MAGLQFRYASDQSHQVQAIDAVVNLFQGQEFLSREFSGNTSFGAQSTFAAGHANGIRVSSRQLIENLHEIQEENCLTRTEELTNGTLRDFTVEMETGTGKTYVYIRSIYELHKKYGLTKFIIVVPSVAIREGVIKSFESTKAHFDELYDHTPLDVFVYDSKNMGAVGNFALSSSIEVMIINIQAFNKEFSKDGEENKGNLFHRRSERLIGGRSPRELVAECNPIVIIDEPQSVDNSKQAKAAIRSLNPLFVLRYSATHKEPYNMLYRLTPVDAFDQHLVKGICVDSVRSAEDLNGSYVRLDSVQANGGSIKAKLTIDVRDKKGGQKRKPVTCATGNDLFVKSNENPDYEGVRGGWVITNISAQEENEFIEFQNGEYLEVGEAVGDVADEAVKRAQIRRTIIDHLQKQLELYSLGIKVLSLFFIDKVEKYRVYNDDGSWSAGEYARVFEEEYRDEVENGMWRQRYEKKGVPLPMDPTPLHQGYFSMDGKGKMKDTSGTTAADTSTFEAIMQSKERLISFPDGHDDVKDISFIFSHSALKEGWDNPNIFQICTLVDSGNEFTKRQKIGRGLRLCVNQQGERNHDPSVNVLTVIANESYDEFARGLQKEFERDGYKFGILTPESFTKIVVEKENGDEEMLGFAGSKALYEYFLDSGMITEKGAITPEFKHAVEYHVIELPPEFEPVKEQVEAIISNKAKKLVIKDKGNEVTVELRKDVTDEPAFQELWEKIRKRTRYELEVDTDKLVEKAIEGISHMPEVRPVEVISSRADLSIDDSCIDTSVTGTAIVKTSTVRAYDLPDPIWELQDAVGLTRSTIKRILEGCGRFDEFVIDPATFLSQVAAKVDRAKLEVLSKGIKYTKLPESDWYTMEVLEVEDLTAYLDQNAYEPKHDKSIYNYVVYDSLTVERPFAYDLDMAEDVKVFAKLPSRFTIDTPVGSYNPDWAYVSEDEYGDKRVFFVVETKGGGNIDPATRPREAAKIDCARKHFAALDDGVTYSVQTTYSISSI